MTTRTPPPVTVPAPTAAALQALMRRAGWEIDFVDLDLAASSPSAVVCIRRADGRWLRASVDAIGRASIATFQRERTLTMATGARGRQPLSPQVTDLFLGRIRCTGARSMLRTLVRYVADNALQPVALRDLRQAWARVMATPLHLGMGEDDEGRAERRDAR